MKLIVIIAIVLLWSTVAEAGGWASRFRHQQTVMESGIRPKQVGSAEGVGTSSRSREDAIRNCCYWGRKTPLSIQTSFRNGKHYALVRYR